VGDGYITINHLRTKEREGKTVKGYEWRTKDSGSEKRKRSNAEPHEPRVREKKRREGVVTSTGNPRPISGETICKKTEPNA